MKNYPTGQITSAQWRKNNMTQITIQEVKRLREGISSSPKNEKNISFLAASPDIADLAISLHEENEELKKGVILQDEVMEKPLFIHLEETLDKERQIIKEELKKMEELRNTGENNEDINYLKGWNKARLDAIDMITKRI